MRLHARLERRAPDLLPWSIESGPGYKTDPIMDRFHPSEVCGFPGVGHE